LQAFFDARGHPVAIRLPCRARTGCCQPFEALAEAIDSFSLRFRHEVRVNR
jgi:hypothetical protein